MTSAYFSPEQLQRINGDPALLSLLYDLDLLPEQVGAAIRHAREEERERCAKIAQDYAKADAGDEDGDCGRVPFEIAKAIRGTSDSTTGVK